MAADEIRAVLRDGRLERWHAEAERQRRSVSAARIAGWVTGLGLGLALWAVTLGIHPW